MRKLEKVLHNKAMDLNISREIISFAKDNDAGVYRFLVDAYEDGVKGVKTFLYMPATLNESDSVRVMTAAMVEYFCGGDYDGTLQALIDEASGAKEEVKEEKPKQKRKRRTKAEIEAEKSDEKPEDKKEEKEDKPKTKREKKPKTIAYDRNQTEHKKELAKILNANFPGWANDKELGAKAKEVSEKVVGVALFDAKGEVLPTFAENVMELMESGSDEQEQVDL